MSQCFSTSSSSIVAALSGERWKDGRIKGWFRSCVINPAAKKLSLVQVLRVFVPSPRWIYFLDPARSSIFEQHETSQIRVEIWCLDEYKENWWKEEEKYRRKPPKWEAVVTAPWPAYWPSPWLHRTIDVRSEDVRNNSHFISYTGQDYCLWNVASPTLNHLHCLMIIPLSNSPFSEHQVCQISGFSLLFSRFISSLYSMLLIV